MEAQLAVLRDRIQSELQDKLTGIYLHGSLAMGCYNPESSDIDLTW